MHVTILWELNHSYAWMTSLFVLNVSLMILDNDDIVLANDDSDV